MKKLISILLAFALLAGCKYDDTELRGQIDTQQARIEALAAEISELRQLLDAVTSGGYVTNVTPIVTSGATVGITVSFRNAPDVTINFGSGSSGSGIRSVVLEDNVLVITLTSDEVVRIPVTTVPVVALEKEQILVFAGGTASVGYTLTGGDSGNKIQLLIEGLWQAEAVATDAQSGKINVTAPDPCTDAKVVVAVASAAGLSSFATLLCAEAHFAVAKTSYKVDAEAGQLKVPVENNLGAFTVEIPSAATWLTAAEVSETEVTFALTENTSDERKATVKLKNEAYAAEIALEVVQSEGGTFIWKPVTTAAGVKAGDCIITYLRASDSKLLFLSGATAINRNPAAVEAAAAGVTFSGDDITAVDAAYVWTAAASDANWTFAGSNGLWLIGSDKYQGAAVLTDLKGYYDPGSTYARTWSFTEDATYGLQMMVTVSAGRHLSVADDATLWSMLPELKGKIILYYKTRL
jgi:hypothetical protein